MAFFSRSFVLPLSPENFVGSIGVTDTLDYTGPSTRNLSIDLSTGSSRIFDNEDSVTTITGTTIWRLLVEDQHSSIEQVLCAGGGDKIVGNASGNLLLGGGATDDRSVGVGVVRDGSPNFQRIEAGLNSLALSHNEIHGGGGRDMIIGDLNVQEIVPEDAVGTQGFFRDFWIDQFGAAFDRLFGDSGEDTLAPGAGLNDELTGGSGSDLFVFDRSNGTYNIMDFEDGWDVIVIADESADAFSALTINQDGDDAVVTFGDTEITFHDTESALLGAGDFAFV
ncbi:hypothetical protein [Primorskyibacter sp. S187A]|uniref:hypothetical protein n=1 Tax=Primorskyibacter sp. S187A TaxID=3415130 RepID=UPI003C7BCDE4